MENVQNNATARRGRTHRVVRQLHLWIGAWGAIAAILFGTTGFVQNHRATMKLPQGESVDLSKVELEVPEVARATPEALRDWLRNDQHIPIDNFRAQPGGPAEMGGQRLKQAGRWMFNGGNARVTWSADYVPGNATVQVRNTEQSFMATLLRLHKGVGGGIAWILLTDTFALSMVLLGITGIVMWARGRNARQMIFSIFAAALLIVAVVGATAVI
ncbi:MAG TPA: PepSY-associated TM helix domain-containing protein [Rudaea sp.]|nr:PepSY-associated TM helix domain-containing protein [Rudaea sp.]